MVSPSMREDSLKALVTELVSRPGHTKLGVQIHRILTDGLGAESQDIHLEAALLHARGHIDALLGNTVFELKSDLRREDGDAKKQLQRYLTDRETDSGPRHVGIATDGASFRAYELRDGHLVELNRHDPDPEQPENLLIWLDSVTALSPKLPADAMNIAARLGRDSPAYMRAINGLSQAWQACRNHPEVSLKRQLWAQFLRIVYGKSVDQDELWLQHTYLVILAKAVAHLVLNMELPDSDDFLSGHNLHEAGIRGAVESDFFDWLLKAPNGPDLTRCIAGEARRFDFHEVGSDTLKGLYESLIDPRQRHDLGEYYTPDWLAEKICRHVITSPLQQTVLDPACGSGSFLFHAIRHLRRTAQGIKQDQVADACCRHIDGFDIHPVAVIIARVTYLLALGNALGERQGDLSLPVYLCDAMQWNVHAFMDEQRLEIVVPSEKDEKNPVTLRYPAGLCEDPSVFDYANHALERHGENGDPPSALRASLTSHGGFEESYVTEMEATYKQLQGLRKTGRNNIWGYVARNLASPLWHAKNQVDILVGNPPWLAYRYMSEEMQARFRADARGQHIWVGKNLVAQQDLSALFFAKSAALYLKRDGVIAFVMPLAALTRGQFQPFRSGRYAGGNVAFQEAWVMDDDLAPLFPVPSCVLIAQRTALGTPTPRQVRALRGQLPTRNATTVEVQPYLREEKTQTPTVAIYESESSYSSRFRQGAALFPHLLCLIERPPAGRLGFSKDAPPVQSYRSRQEKFPWKDLPSLSGRIEKQFLHPVYLGRSILPYRAFRPAEGIIPYYDDQKGSRAVLSEKQAMDRGFIHLRAWLAKAEPLWNEYSKKKRSFVKQINYYKHLSAQFPIPQIRVVCASSGTLPTACILRDQRAIVENSLYWTRCRTLNEAFYLTAILNAESLRRRIAAMQSRGQWGARHIHKLMFTQPIALYDPAQPLHQEIATAGRQAEKQAAKIDIPPDNHFIAARKAVRAALRDCGLSDHIDELVDRLLDQAAP